MNNVILVGQLWFMVSFLTKKGNESFFCLMCGFGWTIAGIFA